ncbi:MAG: hypothetical protein V4857_29265 [Pseudomonadota bacterium]
MRAYVIVTGIVFGLLALAHVARMVWEQPALARDPLYLLITACSAGLALWAWRLLRRRAEQNS